mmetsp:Transcript_47520/g.118852  ORF Transcript_47520/g.118852 Transcript_47520/m.118852 type:complete len:82 (-) Transcript_47520:72-317(-)
MSRSMNGGNPPRVHIPCIPYTYLSRLVLRVLSFQRIPLFAPSPLQSVIAYFTFAPSQWGCPARLRPPSIVLKPIEMFCRSQ